MFIYIGIDTYTYILFLAFKSFDVGENILREYNYKYYCGTG
jgi:hypothetical protein